MKRVKKEETEVWERGMGGGEECLRVGVEVVGFWRTAWAVSWESGVVFVGEWWWVCGKVVVVLVDSSRIFVGQ